MNATVPPKKHPNWTREEHILAFNLYLKIPFGTIHMGNPHVIELARVLGRSVGAVSFKLANFARFDPELKARQIEGMPHGAKGEIVVWTEFYKNPEALAFESERLLAQFTGRRLEQVAEIDEADLPNEGLDRERIVRTRVNQRFFRAAILAAYDNRCCLTGLAIPELLVASHIIPWSADKKNRMNPSNGLCLNALHDRAFDRGLMTIAPDLTARIAPTINAAQPKDRAGLAWLLAFDGKPLRPPRRFKPDPELLRRHASASEAGGWAKNH